MKCLILAAGYATRMYPLTENFPKPLLEVGGKPILDWLVDDLDPVIEQFIVISNHKYAGHFEKWAEGKKAVVVDDGTSTNETRLGAVRDIQFAIDQLGLATDDLLVITDDGTIIRARAADIRVCGRTTQGVKLMRLGENNKVVAVCRAEK